MSDETAVKQRLFVDSTSAKFVVQRSGVGRLKHVSIKHMFLRQLLRQKVFSIHKVPTRINPPDLNTKKLSLERRNLLSSLCGLFPHVSPEREGDEVLFSRRVHRQVTARIVQALQGLSITLLQGCTLPVTGEELQQGQVLRGGRALRGGAPEQGYGWYVFYKEYKSYFLVFVLAIFMVLATTCTMYPGRRLGPRRGGHHQEGGASSSSRPTGGYGDRGGDDPTRRSRTTSRDRGQPEEDVVATLHRRLALMFATVLEGNYTPRETVTPFGIKQTLKHLLGAAQSLDDGYYFVIKEALDYLNSPDEHKAKKPLNDMLKRVEDLHGPLPEENGDISRLLLERYSELLRNIGYPVLRLEEMVYGPTLGPETPSRGSESSHTIEVPFNETASRSRDRTTRDSEEGREDSRDSRGGGEGSQERIRRYQNASLSEVSSPEMWQSLHHFESSSTEEWTRNHHTREGENSEPGEFGGESEPAVEATPEGESLSEQGEGQFNVFEPEGEPSGHGRGVRNPQTYPDLTEEEVSGVQYPGNGIDLSPCSEYERI